MAKAERVLRNVVASRNIVFEYQTKEADGWLLTLEFAGNFRVLTSAQ